MGVSEYYSPTHDFGTLNVKLGYVQSMIFNKVLQILVSNDWIIELIILSVCCYVTKWIVKLIEARGIMVIVKFDMINYAGTSFGVSRYMRLP